MLTYSFSFNKPTTIPPLKKIASAQIAYFLWHANFRLEESISSFPDWVILLNNHREKTTRASHTFTEENNLPRIFGTFFEESICSLYQAYIEMVLWRDNYDLGGEIELLDKNKLYAPNYFTVDGEFNDLAWSKSVVLDPNYPLTYRFYLACFYWFENESAVLWSELKKSDLAPCNGYMSSIQEEMEPIVALKIFQLENQLEILAQNPKYAGNFYKVGFEKAVYGIYEYAIYYFWQNLTEPEKIIITGTDNFRNMFSQFGFSFPDDKISYFLYSQLSKEQKKNFFLDKTIEYDSRYKLVSLLLSPYTGAVRSEIIELVYQLPINLYSEILFEIARDLTEEDRINFSLHSEVFQVLWNNLSPQERDKVFKNRRFLFKELITIKNAIALIEAKSFYNLNM